LVRVRLGYKLDKLSTILNKQLQLDYKSGCDGSKFSMILIQLDKKEKYIEL
jgi:hypothetical protein